MIPDEALLNLIYKIRDPAEPTIHLCQSDPGATADKDITMGSLTEASYPGYSAITLTPHALPAIVSPDDGFEEWDEVTFQPSGMSSPQTIYGYWVTFVGPTSVDKLLAWRRFTTPLILLNDDSQIKITFKLYDKDFSPP